MKSVNPKYNAIIKFAKSKGLLSPLWLLPTSTANDIQRKFQDLESFLHNAYLNGELMNISKADINEFVWNLKKKFAYNGWEGIAPFLLSAAKRMNPKRFLKDIIN